MADIFGQDTKFGGAFKANLARMTFTTNANGDGGLGLLVQNVRSQYQQQVSRIWELGSGSPQNTYLVVGRSQGDLSIARIVGPQAISADFVTKFADACQVSSNVIRINPTPGFCGPTGQASGVSTPRTFNNCLITAIAMQIAAQDMMIQEQVSLMFTEQQNVA